MTIETTLTEPALPRRSLNDALLRVKTISLILVSAVGGVFVGMTETKLGHSVWPMLIGLLLLCSVVGVLADYLILLPTEHLLRRLNALKPGDGIRPSDLTGLPVHRHDEIGELARWVHEAGVSAFRDRHEARRLRRTLDDRIEKATRRATIELRQIAMRDPLTGLGNRRFLEENLEQLVRTVQDAGGKLTAVLMDMDHFKSVNDAFGHAIGDDLLVQLSTVIRGCVRAEDYAIRLGGDEFLVLLPGCDSPRGKEMVDQVRQLYLQQIRNTAVGDADVNISAGVASLDATITTGELLMRNADERLYAAKRAGRGRTHEVRSGSVDADSGLVV